MTHNTAPDPSEVSQPTKAKPSWATEDLVVCQGGPWDGWWFTADDWRERQLAADRMAERHQRPTAISDYAPTETREWHPRIAEASGAVWTAAAADEDGLG